jgi:hypothetical protein
MSNGKPVTTLAINYGREESEMEYYSREELEKMFAGKKNVRIFNIDSKGDFIEDFETKSFGIPLWKYCLIAALFFLMTEALLIRFWKA